ncbi:unnamed protein product [Clonostachys solani]|uniref:CHAT domain-containing protein n=1 Tax=Clonostachys solani TaxID=160281 RepID=A0A9P0EQL0_9HYPO|nr:unnamed protein product [Clonostachys solani]
MESGERFITPADGDENDISAILDCALQNYDAYLDKQDDRQSPLYGGRMLDLAKCIQLYQKVVALTNENDRDHLLALRGLGEAHLDMFNETGDLDDADKSIRSQAKAMQLTLEFDVIGKLDTRKAIGRTYYARFQKSKEEESGSAALADGCLGSAQIFFNFGFGLLGKLYDHRNLHRCDDKKADLMWAIDLLHQSINPQMGENEYEGLHLFHLGGVWGDISRYWSIKSQMDEKQYRGIALFRLGVVCGNRYLEAGDVDFLNRCIALYEEALSLLAPDHPDTVDLLRNLCIAYRDRGLDMGSLEDHELSMHYGEAAVKLLPENESYLAQRLGTLESVYEAKFQTTRNVKHLGMSLKCKEDLLKFTPPSDDDHRAWLLHAVASGYARQFSWTKNIADIDHSIQLDQEALEITPENHPARPDFLITLGDGYHTRFEHNNMEFIEQHDDSEHLIERIDVADLEKSIQLMEAAVNETPTQHRWRAYRLSRLARAYDQRYSVTDDYSDNDRALLLYEQGLFCDSSPAYDRLIAGLELIRTYTLIYKLSSSSREHMYKVALATMEIVPLVAPPSMKISDRLIMLESAQGLGSIVAAIGLSCGLSPLTALQHVERGRGILFKFTNDLRAEESRLRETHPDIADELAGLLARTEAPPAETLHQRSIRHLAGQRLETLISKIDGLPGSALSIPAMSEDDLRVAAERGPIVTINLTTFRCDALIVDRSRTWSLSLPDHSHEVLLQYMAGDRGSPEVLAWLWTNLLKPILDELGFTHAPEGCSWPHVWWIPTSILANFPIHAAGLYTESSYDGVLDRVISSYSNSIHTLLEIRSRQCQVMNPISGQKIVLIAMEETPGHSNLRYASQEVLQLESLCKESGLNVSKPLPNRENVLEALNECTIFHFAGHGQSLHGAPMDSTLLLEDWKTNPLTVSTLCETNLAKQRPFLAYLSACKTGNLVHGQAEGLHLMGACQLAGFRHAVGTLWEVQDQTSADAAVELYKWMLRGGMTDDSVSEGLHHAIRSIRSRWIESMQSRAADLKECSDPALERQCPSRAGRDMVPEPDMQEAFWIPFIHFGV